MALLVKTSAGQMVYNQNLIKIGNTPDCDYKINIGSDKLVIQWSETRQKFVISSDETNINLIFNNKPFIGNFLLENSVKITVAGTNEYILLKVVELAQESTVEPTPIGVIEDEKIQTINIQATTTQTLEKPTTQQMIDNIDNSKTKLDSLKEEIEEGRTSIIKQVGFAINDIKNRIDLNKKASIFVHLAMIASSIIVAFGVSNFLTGLKIEETKDFINLPMNIKILALFSLMIYGLCLLLKQGMFNFYQNKTFSSAAAESAQKLLITSSAIFFGAIYIINLLYYLNINPAFAILISLFFVAMNVVLACAAGYFKFNGHAMSFELDKNEYREDLEKVIHKYRSWIEQYVNCISSNKIKTIKEKLFNVQLKSIGETILGVLTAPFLAYGVSNTLASCFPEAAGWIRISGLRFSPIFLVLASLMIVFAFFSFVNAFLITRKIQASSVIKHDGFSNATVHGLNIFGIQAIKKLENEKNRSLIIGCTIIAIEFTMNTSYFLTEIGGDLTGIILSLVSATVPTALLLAETYMLSATKFDIYAMEDIVEKRDKI